MKRVLELVEAGVFNNQDLALATMAERYDDGSQDLPLIIAWVSQWTQAGHVCLSVDAAAEDLMGEGELPAIEWPSLKQWAKEIPPDHPFVGDGSRATPLVVDRACGLIYLHRWFAAENRVADAIRTRLEMKRLVLSAEEGRRLDELFPDPESAAQRDAVETALSACFSIITGGPGTGKTTTILKLIDLFVHHHGAGVKIALCAPTGKAVSRMDESIRGQINASCDAHLKTIFSFKPDSPVDSPITLHRLLGTNPVRGTCRYNQSNKLPHDLVVVDESSMMDLLLMNQLIHALRPEAHLILVGDKDQLPAVGSGTIFADFCGATGLSSVIGWLTKNWRAQEAPGIVELASLINDGHSGQVMDLLAKGNENVQWVPAEKSLAGLLKEKALPVWEKLIKCSSAEEAFHLLAKFQVLCAVRRGPSGVQAANELARSMLNRTGTYYHGLPILISANERQVNLYNGDMGIVLKDDAGELKAWFPSGSGWRSVALARLPAHGPVYAMTIHKSQGSEAEEILVVLPETESPIMTRELLYTAVTRAKKKVYLRAADPVVRDSVSRTVSRVSGLPFKLADLR